METTAHACILLTLTGNLGFLQNISVRFAHYQSVPCYDEIARESG